MRIIQVQKLFTKISRRMFPAEFMLYVLEKHLVVNGEVIDCLIGRRLVVRKMTAGFGSCEREEMEGRRRTG